MLEKLKKQSKKLYFQNKLKQYENNIENTWNIMKAKIGKYKICNNKIMKSLDIIKEEITDKEIIAETFKTFFINVGSNLADKIPPSITNFESYLPNITNAVSYKLLSEKECLFYIENK